MNNLNRIHSFIFFLVLTFSGFSQARTFKNAYISFEILDTWDCVSQLPEWICRAKDPQESKEAVIILTAKETGPTDKIELYENHMNASITTTSKSGASMTSRVVYKAQKNMYNDQIWLDGLHQDSEVKNYFTRYLATVKGQVSILVTFSAHNKFYAKHSGHFMNTIKSLRIIASKDLLEKVDKGPQPGGGESIGVGPNSSIDPSLLEDSGESKKGALKNETLMGIGLLILAILLYIGYKVYSKKNE